MSILLGVKNDGSQGFPLTKLMAINTGLAQLRRLRPPAPAINRLTCIYTLIDLAVVLSYFFLILYIVTAVAVCQLFNKQMIDWLIDWVDMVRLGAPSTDGGGSYATGGTHNFTFVTDSGAYNWSYRRNQSDLWDSHKLDENGNVESATLG